MKDLHPTTSFLIMGEGGVDVWGGRGEMAWPRGRQYVSAPAAGHSVHTKSVNTHSFHTQLVHIGQSVLEV